MNSRVIFTVALILGSAGRCQILAEEASSPDQLSAIRLNTIGYQPISRKEATVAGTDKEFLIRDLESDKEVYRGRLSRSDGNRAEAASLYVADFSSLTREGRYRLEVGRKRSSEFVISADVYNWPFFALMRGMYLWRCGTAVAASFAGEHYEHGACHTDDAYLDFVGGPPGTRKDGTGGWHDAGDYNKYTVNAAFTVAMMLTAWEHFHSNLASVKLDIPESTNDTPDFLDESRYELEWLLKMQANDGSVYHKLSTRKFGGFILPDKERERRYFCPWSSAATADFAAIMAQAARVFSKTDSKFADRCLAAAKKSYSFLQAHPGEHAPDLSAFETGPYDAPDSDDRVWAAAELWQATGEAAYLRDFEKRVNQADLAADKRGTKIDADWDWGNVRNLGSFDYLLSNRKGRAPAVADRIRKDALHVADAIVDTAKRHAYARPLGKTYYWGCNGTVARQAMNLNVAYKLTGDERYPGTMRDTLNYLFGRNPFGRSFVTGLGAHPPLFPHDRRSGGDKIAAPWPGYLVGGAWPRQSDWFDNQESYQTNEVAINWNGALIYALAAFVEPGSFERSVQVGRNQKASSTSAER